MSSRDDFAVFILTHGRADHVYTWSALDKGGYTGKRYIVIDDEDEQADRYRENFPGKVLQFNKLDAFEKTDTVTNTDERRAIVFARNACYGLAREIGIKYFIQLDDDYVGFFHRYKDGKRLAADKIVDLDAVFNRMVEFLIASKAKTVCMAQGGDFIGGADNNRVEQGLMRKAMNSFVCDADNPIEFVGLLNEDVSTYTMQGSRGDLFFTVCRVMLVPKRTQSVEGGSTEVYKDFGTYVKSFYTVICMPSAVKVSVMGSTHKRMHHKVRWDNCVPQILSERWRKRS